MPSKKQSVKNGTAAKENAEEQAPQGEFEEIVDESVKSQENLEVQLKAKDKRITDLESELKWAKADFDNFRKSMESRLDSEKESIQARILKDFLPFFDTFDRAMQAASEIMDKNQEMDDMLKSFFNGFDGLYKNLNGLIESKKLKRIDALGKKFDYNYHEVSLQIQDDFVEDGTVLQEIQKGWLYNGKVLRPAMVAVSKNSAAQTSESCAAENEEKSADAHDSDTIEEGLSTNANLESNTKNEDNNNEANNLDENQDFDN